MTSETIHCESERHQRWSVLMAAAVSGVAVLMTMYGLSIMAGLIASWLTNRF